MYRTRSNSSSTIYGEKRPTRALKYSQDVGELDTESGAEEAPPADTAVTTQLYSSFDPLKLHSSFDPLKLHTAVHHA